MVASLPPPSSFFDGKMVRMFPFYAHRSSCPQATLNVKDRCESGDTRVASGSQNPINVESDRH